jgi:hypothetical protein
MIQRLDQQDTGCQHTPTFGGLALALNNRDGLSGHRCFPIDLAKEGDRTSQLAQLFHRRDVLTSSPPNKR